MDENERKHDYNQRIGGGKAIRVNHKNLHNEQKIPTETIVYEKYKS